MKPRSYTEAGVNIERGDRFAKHIAAIRSSAVSDAIGSFAGGMPLDTTHYEKPVLLASTDGVGTKLLVAKRLGDYSTVGIDLVAMCVNDLAVCGADPLIFLDYIACGTIDESRLADVMDGIVQGCETAGCTLSGGETAELPDMYGADDIDLAGFAVGVAEAGAQLPRPDRIVSGDLLVGVPSSGIHANGLSLARKIFEDRGDDEWKQLLTPTRIYVDEMRRARSRIKAAAHITGGGLLGNVSRVLPDNLIPRLDWNWRIPEIFTTIRTAGRLPDSEMRSVFNMGIGLVVVAEQDRLDDVRSALGDDALLIGEVVDG